MEWAFWGKTSLGVLLESKWLARLAWVLTEGYCARSKENVGAVKKKLGVTYGVRHAGWLQSLLRLTAGVFLRRIGVAGRSERRRCRQ